MEAFNIAYIRCACGSSITYPMNETMGVTGPAPGFEIQHCPGCGCVMAWQRRGWKKCSEDSAFRIWDVGQQAWQFRLWCPDCDRFCMHDMQQIVGECLSCGEPHDLRDDEQELLEEHRFQKILEDMSDLGPSERFYAASGPAPELDRRLYELAEEYHNRCDAYDARVCTGEYRGVPVPASGRERRSVNIHAREVEAELWARARKLGFEDRTEFLKAIHAAGCHD